MKSNLMLWDQLLTHTELAHNKTPTKTTGLSPFKVVYGIGPLSLLDLTPPPMDSKPNMEATKRVQEIQELHKKIRGKIE